jgi:hypothetical protein
MTDALSRIERNGLRVNLDTLDLIEVQYKQELEDLERDLNDMAREAVGDWPISLTSPDHRSMLLYSRVVKDKPFWHKLFNLGMEKRGATMKPKRTLVYSTRQLALSVLTVRVLAAIIRSRKTAP